MNNLPSQLVYGTITTSGGKAVNGAGQIWPPPTAACTPNSSGGAATLEITVTSGVTAIVFPTNSLSVAGLAAWNAFFANTYTNLNNVCVYTFLRKDCEC